MSEHVGRVMALGDNFYDLIEDQRIWSEATFGTTEERGPAGPLKHLALEIMAEMLPDHDFHETIDRLYSKRIKMRHAKEQQSMTDPTEYADLLILLLDCSRRAGIKPLDLIHHAQKKMEVNKGRKWPKGQNPNAPVEHTKGQDDAQGSSNDG